MNISVFGIGYVGCVSLGCLAADGHNIIGVDTNESKIELINSGNSTVLEKDIDAKIYEGVKEKKIIATDDFRYAVKNSEISIVCVGTPSGKNGSLDLSHVIKVAEQIGEALLHKDGFHIISIRSSIVPGTIKKIEKIISEKSKKITDEDFSVLANPEFLREGTAVKDYYSPSFTLIGGSNKDAMERLASIYKNVRAEVIFSEVGYAELIKFVNNSFHALKVSFTNEVGNICHVLGLDSRKFMDLIVKDTKLNISSNYMKPGFAYGGSCLPKDLKALESIAKESGVNISVISGINETNEFQIEKAFQLISRTGKKNIGFLGMTFKEGTDDVRNSPYISLVKKLLNKKFIVKIYDKNIVLENLVGANKDYLFKELPIISDYIVRSVKDLISNSDLIVVANSKLISKKDIPKFKNKIIVDLVNIDAELQTKDNYIGLSW